MHKLKIKDGEMTSPLTSYIVQPNTGYKTNSKYDDVVKPMSPFSEFANSS